MATKIDPSEIGKRGGKARAKSLSPEQRSEIARKAAAARWGDKKKDDTPRVMCGGQTPLCFGDGVEAPCYVLDDERRVITTGGIQLAFGMSAAGGAPRLIQYLARVDPDPSSVNEFAVRLKTPILFRIKNSGKPARGYEATLLSDICDSLLEAHQTGLLESDTQRQAAHQAEALAKSWAGVGIIALVDEATGFEKKRNRLALAEILEDHLEGNLYLWAKTFPDEFYEHFFRLRGMDYSNLEADDVKPEEVIEFVKDGVYGRLDPGIVEELERKTPNSLPGQHRHKHQRWLTGAIGHADLENHLVHMITVMKLSTDWSHFERNLQVALPKD